MFSAWKKPKGGWSRRWHPSQVYRPRHDPLSDCQNLRSRAERIEAMADWDHQAMDRLDEAISMASPYLTERWIPTTSLINPMLGVWEVANAIHPAVARPVEEFLTSLIHRTTVTPAEFGCVVDEVRVLALQASVLASGAKVS
jgi:hypothetical protein